MLFKDCAQAGVKPVVSGSMGEAVHLVCFPFYILFLQHVTHLTHQLQTHSERIKLILTARSALDTAGLSSVPIIAGAGSASTRETIKIAQEAAGAGADQVIVVPPGYYAGALDREALKQLWGSLQFS